MINTINISTVLWVEVADIFLGSFEMLLKQDSDHLTEAFNYRGSPSSYLFHSSAFSFIIKTLINNSADLHAQPSMCLCN